MALILTGNVEQEAKRISSSQNAFEVLGISPEDTQPDVVLKSYETKVSLFKRLVRNRIAIEAKAKLDYAKMTLLDDMLRAKETTKFYEHRRKDAKIREELKEVEARTKLLEQRAAALSV